MNIPSLLENQAEKFAHSPAFDFKSETISFLQLKEYSFALANSLKNLGVMNSQKVAIYLPNSLEYVFSYLANWSIGSTVVPLDFMLTEEELVSCISHSEASVLITMNKPQISLRLLKEKCPTLKDVIICRDKDSEFLSFEELLKKGSLKKPEAGIKDNDYAIIFYTSGTTGRPKGVLVSYLQLEASPEAMHYFVGLNQDDIALCAVPLSHLGGLVYLQSTIFLGSRTILMERFIPAEFLKNVQAYKVTCFWLVPSMYYAILQLKELESFDLSSLKWVVSFGAPSSPDQLRRFHSRCPGAALIHGWGLTETNAPNVVIPKGSPKIESIGLPAPWIEVKVFDDQDRESPCGSIGEIVMRSWVVSDGYYKDHEATALAMRNGWFHTGDLGRLDREGYLYIVGRKKEMIKVSGEIVFEPELETAIHRHPDVAEVAVIGVADSLRGEVPKAFVVLKEGSSLGPDDLRYFCRQHLAHFKIPHYFEFLSSLPKTRSGKIDKEALRGKYA